jgi:hypothetical protein
MLICICANRLPSVSATIALGRHHTSMPAGGAIHPISSKRQDNRLNIGQNISVQEPQGARDMSGSKVKALQIAKHLLGAAYRHQATHPHTA